MDNLPEIKKKPEDAHLQINNLSFLFIGRKKLFEHISMEIKKGEIVTFFGEIGSGKSTLIQTYGYSPNVSCRNF
ncbi:hypothetical protein FACS1894177_02170 [Bacteroidia bacterium]|nr:hypothetical protein FACS1894177_02170 [Bacteroidia bacterium]